MFREIDNMYIRTNAPVPYVYVHTLLQDLDSGFFGIKKPAALTLFSHSAEPQVAREKQRRRPNPLVVRAPKRHPKKKILVHPTPNTTTKMRRTDERKAKQKK